MPVKLLPRLRLLQHSLPVARFSTMKPDPSLKFSSQVVPVFSRVFPHKLKYQSVLSRRLGFPILPIQLRRFSSRSGRLRPETRAPKSLIEDEAELSDWVSGLRSDSSRTRLYSDSDNEDNRGSSRGRSTQRDRVSSAKRRRENDSDDYEMSSRRRGGGSSGPFSKNSRENSRFDGRINGGGLKREGRGSQRGGFIALDEEIGDEDEDERKRSSRPFSKNSREKSRFDGRRNGGGLTREGQGSQRGGFLALDDDERKRSSGPFSKNSREKSRFDGRRNGGGLKREGKSSQRGGFLALDEEIGDEDEDERKRSSGPFSKNSREKSRFDGRSNGGGLKREGKSSQRGGFLALDEEIGDEDEDERKRPIKSFRDLMSEEDSDDDDDDDEEEEEEEDDDDVNIRNSANSLFGEKKEMSPRAVLNSPRSESYLSETRFDQCSVSPLSLKGIKDAGYEKMTVVQEATLPLILKGKDVLAKAKTGTGKTVAFLLPSIEVVVKSPPIERDNKRPPILVLVICPTRELASQAAAEANTLLKYHPSIGVQVVIGGTRLALEQKRMQANPCQILVATPGRLKDHLENTAGFATRLMGVKVLVLDEADHLLDMGFRKDIERIIAAVPKQRQTLLFSATVPQEVRQICHIALRRDHEFVDTVGEGSEQTHSQVRQMHLVAPLDKHFSLLYVLLKEHISDDVDYKVLVFCTTAMVTRLVADLLNELNLNVREIHSRKPQNYRTRVSDEFRKSKGLILVTSDVSARGVDYPDVTLVIQVGLPSDREQYIHRLGRTGRKGKEGQGILLLAPWEEFFLSSVKDLPITKAPGPMVDPETRKKVERALSHVEMKNKEAAYQAWLGYYNSNKTVARDKHRLVELANEFSRSMGLDNPPAIPKLVLGKMGLRNIPGLRSK